MAEISAHERQRILAIARQIRERVVQEGRQRFKEGKFAAVCALRPTSGGCADASFFMSKALQKKRIKHDVVVGCWTGPLDDFAREFKDPDDPECGPGGMGHVWVEFPQFDGAILDVTGDQFDASMPEIMFPAKQDWYRPDPIIPKGGLTPRRHINHRSPLESTKVRVRRHLKRPPRSCLCHRSKTVDRVRRGMVRRLR